MEDSRIKEIMDQFHPSVHFWELQWLAERVEELKPKIIVEIGNYKGGSLAFWREILGPDGLLIGIDPAAVIRDNFPIKFKRIKLRSQSPNALKRLEQILNGRKVDFVFVDGDHDIPHIDYKNYFPYIRDGGGMAFHDHKEGRNRFDAIGGFDNITWDKEEFLGNGHYFGDDGNIKNRWGVGMIWKRQHIERCKKKEI